MAAVSHSPTIFGEHVAIDMAFWLGIDLGTTNSCVYRVSASTGDVVPTPLGNTLTPSVVHVGPDSIECGDMVSRDAVARHVFFGFKRTIGRKYKDYKLWASAKEWPFSVIKPTDFEKELLYSAPHGGEIKNYTAKDLYVHLLRYMLRDVDVKKAKGIVVTVPAHFGTVQRDATKAALRNAGVDPTKVAVMNEPTAAAVAFLDDHREMTEGRLLVVDVGGGTVDCTLLDVETMSVIDSKGTSEVGGEVITDALVAKKRPKGLKKDALGAFRQTVEDLKKRLSMQPEATESGICITREELNSIAEPTITAVCDLAATVGGREQEPTAVVLCGGTTRMSALRKRLQEVYPKSTVSTDLNPLTAVARGAALHAKALSVTATECAKESVKDILTASIGVRVGEDEMGVMAAAGSKLPCRVSKMYRPMRDDQEYAEIVIYQGNEARASDNFELGRFRLRPTSHWIRVDVEDDGSAEVAAVESHTQIQVHLERVKVWNE